MNSLHCMRAVSLLLAGIFFASAASAGECGKTLQTRQLEHLVNLVTGPQENILQYSSALLQEAEVASQSGNDRLADTILREQDRLDKIYDAADRLVNILDQSLMLAKIRDRMLDVRDKETVERHLSHVATRLGKSAVVANRPFSRLIPKLTRPGNAVEAAKVRDAIREVAVRLDGC